MTDQPISKSTKTSGQSSEDRILNILQKLITDQIVPGAIVLVQKGSQPAQAITLGTDGAGQSLSADMLFPVASITKLATALAVLRLIVAKKLALDLPFEIYLPDAAAAKQYPRLISVRSLLCHAGGLPEDLAEGAAPYEPGLDWPKIAAASLQTPAEQAPWTKLVYSNIGYAQLAVIVERLTGLTFPQALKKIVLEPLNVEGYLGEEPPRRPAVISGKLGREKGTSLESFNSPFWRSLALPYGGLVTTAEGCLKLVQAYAGRPSGFLPEALLIEARQDQSRGLPGQMAGLYEWDKAPWGLGIELRGHKTPHSVSPDASPSSFGHLGSTGAMAWLDPERDISWVILGPRLFHEWWRSLTLLSTAILN